MVFFLDAFVYIESKNNGSSGANAAQCWQRRDGRPQERTKMANNNKLLAWLLAGGTAVGAAAGGGFYFSQQPADPQPAALVTPEPATKPAETTTTAPETKTASLSAAMPRFDILRVEKDGSTVVAGSAAPGSKVELMSGDTVVASAMAGPGGDFALVLDKPLEKGAHDLVLKATDAAGASVMSEETGVVTIPDAGGELIAMVTKPGEASRILQKGEPKAAETAAAATAESKPADPAAPAAKQVLVSAVDFENGRIFVAGSGEAGRTVNVYIDDVLAGTTSIGADGAFLLEAASNLTLGTHKIRADMLAATGTEVETRSEVPLVHEEPAAAEVAAAQPAKPAEEAKPSESVTAAAEPAKPAETTTAAAEPAKPAETTTAAAEPAKPAEEAKANETVTAAAPATEPIKTGASVIIRRGDNLWRVSRRLLGKGVRYTVIYEANKGQIKDPSLIFPGQVFEVPGGKEG
jgi:nucleoid-associated protein YgaU